MIQQTGYAVAALNLHRVLCVCVCVCECANNPNEQEAPGYRLWSRQISLNAILVIILKGAGM